MTIKEKLSVILSENPWLNKFIFASLAFIVTFILPASSFSQVISQRQADSAKRCAICHYNWVHAFFEEHRDGELAPFPEEIMVKKKELCFSCHDDDMTKMKFIHGPVANNECNKCHNPHTSEHASLLEQFYDYHLWHANYTVSHEF